ncbi:hypothetical protein BDQ17DRAFT_1237574 [Cyathus striatus]|nr:hypothetical protein BDQ17DRAFT_1237574 [Cyathus striatus]
MQVDSSTNISDSSNAAGLQAQIQNLTDLYNRVTALRCIPPHLLRSPSQPSPLSPAQNDIRSHFTQLHQVADTIRSSPVQQALKCAQSSFESDPTELTTNPRRENRKRRRPPTPESPQPYVNVEPTRPPLFPPLDSAASPLSLHDLHDYVLQFNCSHKSRLHIWHHTPPPSTSSTKPRILRLITPDVLTAYVTFDTKSESDPALVVETVSTFGSREKKAPHSQSNFAVFRQVSQQISKMLHSEPDAPLQSVIDLLNSYEALFVDPCHLCTRVLTVEGHVPPVVRVWSEIDGVGKWKPKHVSCK